MMTLLTTTGIVARLAHSTVIALSACATAFSVLVRRRETYHSLSMLDDRTLRDIGLNRSMLMGVAIHGIRTPRRTEPMVTIANAHTGHSPLC